MCRSSVGVRFKNNFGSFVLVADLNLEAEVCSERATRDVHWMQCGQSLALWWNPEISNQCVDVHHTDKGLFSFAGSLFGSLLGSLFAQTASGV